MRIRIKWVGLAVFLTVLFITATFGGLAGYFSFIVSLALPVYAIVCIVYIIVSWLCLTWHQNFSTNHPQKGETIRFSIYFANSGFIPLADGTCKFTMPGKHNQLKLPVGFIPGTKRVIEYETEISCPYRGTYVAGVESINFSTPLGIIQTEIGITPQIFYVYPELCALDASVEKYAVSSGVTVPCSGKGNADLSIFEYTAQIREELPGARIAWKRWAATGIPAAVINGQSRSKGLTVVLDLFPCNDSSTGLKSVSEEEKLAAEDMIISAAFSVVQYLAVHEIPVTFISGGNMTGPLVDSEESFRVLFEKSTGYLFKDTSFPSAAFVEDSTAVLFSTRPLSLFFHEYEIALHKGNEPHVFLCPPPSRLSDERDRSEIVHEQRNGAGSRSLFYIADARNGSKEITDAFKA